MKTPKALAVSLAAFAALAPVALALTPTGPGEFRLETESDVSYVADGFAVPAGSTITVRPGVFRPEGGPVGAPPSRERRTPGSCRAEKLPRQADELAEVAPVGVERRADERRVFAAARRGGAFAGGFADVGGDASGGGAHGWFRGGVGEGAAAAGRFLPGTLFQARQKIHLPGLQQLC